MKYVTLPICRLFPVLTHFPLLPVKRPVMTVVRIYHHFDLSSHRHDIFEFIQTGVDPRPPLSLEQGLGDLLVGVRL